MQPEQLTRRAELLARQPIWAREFDDLSYEWRRLFSELFGTFLLVLAAAGGAVLDARTQGGIGRAAAVTAPGLTVLAVILFMGAVSGAHLNPVVSVAFALRRDFEWRRSPAKPWPSSSAPRWRASCCAPPSAPRGRWGPPCPGQGSAPP